MAYVSEWELPAGGDRPGRRGDKISEAQAKTDICQAIADRAIGFGQIKKHATRYTTSGAVLKGSDLEMPANLTGGLDGESHAAGAAWFDRGIFRPRDTGSGLGSRS